MLEQQIAFLSERRRVTLLSKVVEQIASDMPQSADSVCIMFDDWRLRKLTIAVPILEAGDW